MAGMSMNLKTEEATLGEFRFTCTQFPAMRGTVLLARLVKIMGPALAALMKLDPNAALTDTAVVGELSGAFAALNPDEIPPLVAQILQCTSVATEDGTIIALDKPTSIDLVFSGRLFLMFQAVGFALRVNFGNFSAGSAPAAPRAKR
jgi:hypothetical protein